MQNQQQPQVGPLLERMDRIRGLARTLVRDAATADDLVQQAVLVALSGGSSASGPQGDGWIRTVLTNLLRDRRRSERSRSRREGRVAREEDSVSSTEAIVSNAERHRDLVEAVLELSEPYRETVLLRHFEDLPPREIARRTGRPVETVKKHLTRGHAQLRKKLEGRYGGQGQWAVALLPLAGDQVLRGMAGGLSVTKVAGALALACSLAVAVRTLPIGSDGHPTEPVVGDEVADLTAAGQGDASEEPLDVGRRSSGLRVPVASATTSTWDESDRSAAGHTPGKATLPVTLLGPGGLPVRGGVIVVGSVLPGDGNQDRSITDVVEFNWTEEDDVLLLEPGRVNLRGFSGLFEEPGRDSPHDARDASAMQLLDLEPGPNQRITLVTQPRTGLHVTPRVDGVAGPVVRILQVQPGEPVDEDALMRAEQGEDSFGWLQNSTDDAVWTFMDLDPGTYAVGAMSWLGTLYGYELVEVGQSLVEMDLEISAPNDRQLSVFVAGPDGRAVLQPERVRFSLERSRAGEQQVATGVGSRSPEGTFTVWFPDEQAKFFNPTDPSAQYSLVVRHSVLGEVRTNLLHGQLAVDVTLSDTVSAQVRLVGRRDATLMVRFVSLDQFEEGVASLDSKFSKFVSFSSTDNEEKRIVGLPPGRYRVSLVAPMFANGVLEESTIGSQLVEVWQEDTRVRFRVPRVYELEVLAPDLQGGTALTLRPAKPAQDAGWDQGSWTRTLDASRRCTFLFLLPGNYILDHEGGSARITVPCEAFTLK